MFWIILGTASFTALVISWAMVLWFSKDVEKVKKFAKRNGFCYTCGAPLIKIKEKKQVGFKKQPMGFNKNE